MPFDESHVDDDLLALLALGEPAGSMSDLAHIEECERCADELESLREVVELARSGGPDRGLVAPAPAVWDRIAGELRLSPGVQGLATSAEPAAPAPEPVDAPAHVVELESRRGRPRAWRWVAAAAAAGLVVGGGGAWWAAHRNDPTTVLATATLEPLPGWDASGSAVVETAADGSRVLVVDLTKSAPSDDGFREVWLLKPDVSGLVSVGTLTGSTGRFDLPAGLDLSQYSVVDVSEEQFDGNPAHSGDSIVRGPLRA
ncbi:anti-sigma factor [Cellulomonas sp. ICMP 17802]|uniref:anti-sigma factor n=1 Tax=Cellulomonas sp. ICMP 17802 TaxID=3239199 RepID=UPI00351ADE87